MTSVEGQFNTCSIITIKKKIRLSLWVGLLLLNIHIFDSIFPLLSKSHRSGPLMTLKSSQGL